MKHLLFTSLSAVSLLLCMAVYVLKVNSYARINGHFEVFAFGKRAGEALAWFLFGDLRPLPLTPSELLLYVSPIAPAIWVVYAVAHRLRVRRRSAIGRCPACGYDLRASPGLCPECGATPKEPRGLGP